MRKTSILLLSGLVIVAVSAVVSASASAAFNRQWQTCVNVGAGNGTFENSLCTKPGGGKEWEWKTLLAGESRGVKDQGGEFVFKEITQTITCKKVTSKGTIYGGTPGTDESSETFTECTTKNTGCKVRSAGGTFGSVVVPPSKTKLEEKSSKLVDNFEQNGSEFVTLEFSPENEPACEGEGYVRGKVTGNVTGEVNGGELKFPSTGSNLIYFGTAATLTGTSSQELAGGGGVRGH
jgi:hypothetical protein